MYKITRNKNPSREQGVTDIFRERDKLLGGTSKWKGPPLRELMKCKKKLSESEIKAPSKKEQSKRES